DGFGINYGLAGIGSEILANRLGVGPMGNQDAVDLKYEEFFLSAWAVGDPAMVVDVPANANFQAVSNPEKGVKVQTQGSFVPNRMEPDTAKKLLFEGQELINKGAAASDPSTRAKLLFEGQELIKLGAKPTATKAFYPDDPSNVYHSYMNEHVK